MCIRDRVQDDPNPWGWWWWIIRVPVDSDRVSRVGIYTVNESMLNLLMFVVLLNLITEYKILIAN